MFYDYGGADIVRDKMDLYLLYGVQLVSNLIWKGISESMIWMKMGEGMAAMFYAVGLFALLLCFLCFHFRK